MALSPLRGVQACVFDAYGTLFDFAAAARKVLGDDTRFITLWRDKQLQYTWLRAAQERHAVSCRSPATRSTLRWKRSSANPTFVTS
jgi:HAD superfamily hydrolase (TIGR01493 family)